MRQIETDMSGPKCFFDISIGGKEGRSSFTPIIVVGRIVMQLYAVRASFNFPCIGCSKNCRELPVYIRVMVYCSDTLYRRERAWEQVEDHSIIVDPNSIV